PGLSRQGTAVEYPLGEAPIQAEHGLRQADMGVVLKIDAMDRLVLERLDVAQRCRQSGERGERLGNAEGRQRAHDGVARLSSQAVLDPEPRTVDVHRAYAAAGEHLAAALA